MNGQNFLARLQAVARALDEHAQRMTEQSDIVDLRTVGRRLVLLAGDLTTLGVDMAIAVNKVDSVNEEGDS